MKVIEQRPKREFIPVHLVMESMEELKKIRDTLQWIDDYKQTTEWCGIRIDLDRILIQRINEERTK